MGINMYLKIIFSLIIFYPGKFSADILRVKLGGLISFLVGPRTFQTFP